MRTCSVACNARYNCGMPRNVRRMFKLMVRKQLFENCPRLSEGWDRLRGFPAPHCWGKPVFQTLVSKAIGRTLLYPTQIYLSRGCVILSTNSSRLTETDLTFLERLQARDLSLAVPLQIACFAHGLSFFNISAAFLLRGFSSSAFW